MKEILALIIVLLLCHPASSVAQRVLWSQEASLPLSVSQSGALSVIQIRIDPSAIENFNAGESISLQLENGVTKTGVISLVESLGSGNGTRIIGSLSSEKESVFSLDVAGNQISGVILRRSDKFGYRLTPYATGTILEKLDYGVLVCDSLPLPPGNVPDALLDESQLHGSAYAASVSSVPSYSSNPGASHVLYLDFDGETVSDSIWNTFYTSGEPILAQPYSSDGDPTTFTTQEVGFIRRAWKGVRDAYAIYEVNVTTDRTVYDRALISQKQMAIITPTYEWMPGFPGGAAIPGSFGMGNRPVFAFLNGLLTQSKWMSNTLSHELGHAFGLAHDGLDGQEYHPGQGLSVNNAYGWGPIMGAPYNAFYLTWSNGDYAGSTNTEDDIAKIGAKIPFKNDLVANNNAGARALGARRLRRTVGFNDNDVYRVYADKDQRILATVTVEGQYPTLNSQLLLYTASGQLVSQSSPPPTIPDHISTQNSSISFRVKQSGTYFLHVKGAGFNAGPNYSHSAYGAVGNYQILASVKDDPIITPILNILLLDHGA